MINIANLIHPSLPLALALALIGIFVGNIPVFVRAQLNKEDPSVVVLKMAVRSSVKEVSQLVSECIQ